MKKVMLIFIVMITCGIVLATTFDTSVPPDTGESPSGGAERIRNLAAATREINNIEHYWPLDGDVVDDPDKGMHRKVEFQAQLVTPTIAADQGMLYIYDVNGGSGAKAELYWHGEDDYALQMTELNAAGNAAALNITGTYENEVDFSNTGNAFNTDDLACTAGGLLTLPDDTTDTTESNLRYNTTDDVVEFRNASAWKELIASTGGAKMKVGTYTGDGGATKAITGVGFLPDVVFVFPMLNDSLNVSVKTTDMGSTNSKLLGGSKVVTDSIRSLDADGFTVGYGDGNKAAGDMNISGATYCYVAAVVLD